MKKTKYFINNFIYIPIKSRLKIKYKKKKQKITKKRKLYVHKYIVLRKLFKFQNKYVMVLEILHKI